MGTGDGGTIIRPNANGRWFRIYSGPKSVKWFGAKGDGTTDDTAAIQLAINSITSFGKATILFPPGTYKVSALTSGGYSSALTLLSGLALMGQRGPSTAALPSILMSTINTSGNSIFSGASV